MFTIPGEPQGKARARTVSQGGKIHGYTPPKTALYERLVQQTYKNTFPRQDALTGAIQLVLRAYMPIPQSWAQSKKAAALAEMIAPTVRPDLDNIVKCVLDACNGVAWQDDRQITHIEARKTYSAMPRVEVEIWQE